MVSETGLLECMFTLLMQKNLFMSDLYIFRLPRILLKLDEILQSSVILRIFLKSCQIAPRLTSIQITEKDYCN